MIDSAVYEEDGQYYLFLKSEKNPETIILEKAEHLCGPWTRVAWNHPDDFRRRI